MIRREETCRWCPSPVTRDWEGEDYKESKVEVDGERPRRSLRPGRIPPGVGLLTRTVFEIESIPHGAGLS